MIICVRNRFTFTFYISYESYCSLIVFSVIALLPVEKKALIIFVHDGIN